MEEDLILGEEEKQERDKLDIIDNQLMLINSLYDYGDEVYTDFVIERNMLIQMAIKIIHKAQKKIFKEI
jgi:hypothetical protein